MHLRPGSLNVTNLGMVRSSMSSSRMLSLVIACPKLKSFRHQTSLTEPELNIVMLQELVIILHHVKETLEELCLTMPPWSYEAWINSLADFYVLKFPDTTVFS
jgi:hypothetical protein